MTKVEKQISILMVVFISAIFALVYLIDKRIDDAGGMKNIIINVGKEIKDISKKIDE